MALRAKKLSATDTETQWVTSSGGVFTEPVQRPSLTAQQVTILVHLPRADYKLLEVLQDDVARYVSTLVQSHVRGLRKSAEHNKKVKENATGCKEE